MQAQISDDGMVRRTHEGHRPAPESVVRLAHRDQLLGPVQQRGEAARLRFDVDGFVSVDRIHHRRGIEARRVAAREAAVAVRAPLHRRAHAVAVAEIDVVAHADLVAVVDDRRAGERQQQRIHQFDLAPVVVHQRRKAAADAEIDPGTRIGGIGRPQVVALDVGHHLERQFVVVAQEHRPLAVAGDVRRLAQDVDDREAILLGDRHVDARHEREVVGHVAFVAVAEILLHVLGPLVGLGEQHLSLRVGVELGAQLLDHGVGLGKVLVRCALALAEVGNGIQPETVDAGVEPALHHLHHGADDARIVEIQVGLVREEAMPVIGVRLRVPGPVRFFRVGEDDAGLRIALVGIAPDVPVACAGAGRTAARAPKPWMLIGGVIDDELGDDAQAAPLGFGDEAAEILHRAEIGIDRSVVGDVVTVVAARRGIERQQPDRGDAELLQIVQLLGQSREVADAVVVASRQTPSRAADR